MNPMTKKVPLNIIQITDTHLYGNPGGTLLKMNTMNSLVSVIQKMQKTEKAIDLILATGDIAQDASESAYEYFIAMFTELGVPFRWIPGNHDDVKTMQRIASGTPIHDKQVTLGNWQILLLDSSIKGQVHGKLARAELDFLEQSLAEIQASDAIQHCLICLHHNPVPGTARWMRDIGLENGPQFFEIIRKYPKVKSVVYAHIHQELDYQHGGVRCFCTPSTCIQFKPNVTGFELDRLNPGYRSLQLFADGKIETSVVRVTGETFVADFSSGGY